MRTRSVLSKMIYGLTFAAASATALAEDPFHISYRQQNLSSDGLTQSGMLLVTVVNVSGEDVQQLMASVPGPNNVTYDNRSILVGDLADGWSASRSPGAGRSRRNGRKHHLGGGVQRQCRPAHERRGQR